MTSSTAFDEFYVGVSPMIGAVSAVLQVEVEQIDVTSGFGHTQPDPRWTFVDRGGHWHAAATRVTGGSAEVWYPTLLEWSEPNPDYDPEADYNDVDDPPSARLYSWRCAICHETVAPRTITSYERRYIAGREQWRIAVQVKDDRWWDNGLPGSLFTVRGIVARAPSAQHPTPGNREWFGVARWHPAGMSVSSDGAPVVTGTFEGVADLGERVR